MLRWIRDRTCVHCLAHDAGISQATGYRYFHEGIDVLAERCPDLRAAPERCRLAGMTHVILDGTLIDCDRLTGTTERGNDPWYSGKGCRFAGNLQVIATPDGTPLWVSGVSPASVHDLTATRRLVLPALRTAIRDGLRVLADIGYIGAPGIFLPVRKHPDLPQDLAPDNQTYNTLSLSQ
ncbi:transposase family protein [Streptomyces sp. NPDC002730]|uniref:transposase family protein n=1 Tax=Streptomyces sp. NPDC002730 TaxID=3364662 RepID=UPI0036A9B8BB